MHSLISLSRRLRYWLNSTVDDGSDGFGSAEFRPYTISCRGGDCGDSFAVVFSGIYEQKGGPPFRVAVAFLVNAGSDPRDSRITKVVSLLVPGARGNMLRGGRVAGHLLPADLKGFNQYREFAP